MKIYGETTRRRRWRKLKIEDDDDNSNNSKSKINKNKHNNWGTVCARENKEKKITKRCICCHINENKNYYTIKNLSVIIKRKKNHNNIMMKLHALEYWQK